MKAFFAVVILMTLAFGGTYAYQRTDLPERLGLVANSGKAKTYYQYVDDTGRMQFAKTLDAVPAKWRDRAGRIELDRPPAEAAAAARQSPARAESASPNASPSPAAEAAAVAPGGIVIYTKNDCSACLKALRHLDSKDLEYTTRNIDEDASAEADYRRKAGFAGGMPLIDVRGKLVEGYDRAKLNELLSER